MRDIFLGLNQKNALELKENYLDRKGESFIKIEDLILIRRLQDFMASSKTVQVIIDNEIYSWVHYETIQEDLPMIFPSVVSLKKRVEKLKKMGLIINKSYAVRKDMTNKDTFEKAGKYSVIKLSKECRTLFDFSNMTNLKPSESEEEQKGIYHDGVKGKHHDSVKGKHHDGVNKEYQEINTKKEINTCKEAHAFDSEESQKEKNNKGFIVKDKWEKFINENLSGIDYQKNIQVAIKNLEKKWTEKQIQEYLLEVYRDGIKQNLSLALIATTIAKEKRLSAPAKKIKTQSLEKIDVEEKTVVEQKRSKDNNLESIARDRENTSSILETEEYKTLFDRFFNESGNKLIAMSKAMSELKKAL